MIRLKDPELSLDAGARLLKFNLLVERGHIVDRVGGTSHY